MAKLRRVYWDSCVWISLIAQEKEVDMGAGRKVDRFAKCRAVLRSAENGSLEIATSCFTLAEVCKKPELRVGGLDNLAAFFEHSYILMVPVDVAVGRKAQSLQSAGLIGLKPPDAVHLASAIRANVDEFHSFDQGVLRLNGQLERGDGIALSVVEPGESGGPMPLFEDA